MSHTHIIGDIHGQYTEMIELLRDDVHLINEDLHWCGGAATLCFVGDYFDRGPDGFKVVDTIMRLESEAADADGQVLALLGNHDVMFLAAYRFRERAFTTYSGSSFIQDWITIGGQPHDMKRMTDQHVQWLTQRPVMLRLEERLVIHADATFYMQYGSSIAEVNQRIRRILHSDEMAAWNMLLDDFVERNTFQDRDTYGRGRPGGTQRARMMLELYGGTQIIHGHTPIPAITGEYPGMVTTPLIYANGLCINVDGGMYRGGPGFVYSLETTSHNEALSD